MRTRFALAAVSIAVAIAGCAAPAPTPTGGVTDSPTATPSASASETPTATPTVPVATIPTTCNLKPMLREMEKQGFPGAVDATPPWDPAAGTTLKIAIDGGGRACGWAPPGADAGVAIWWTIVTPKMWKRVGAIDESSGMAVTDIPGLNEDTAYWVYEPLGGANEFPRWEADALFGNLWIHMGSISWDTPDGGNAFFERALTIAGLTP